MYGQDQVVFEQLTTNDGLSNGTIQSIFKDSRGFMWFCTDDGLNKYDGYRFSIYKSELSDIVTTQNLQFFYIVEDIYSNIWIGTSEGLYFYDEESDRIVQFSKLPNIGLTNTPLNGSISCLLFDTSNYLWVGSYTGISRIKISNPDIRTIKKEDISVFTSNSNNLQNLSNNNIFSFFEDKQHQIWVSSNSDQLDCYNYEKNNFKQYRIEIPGIKKWGDLFKLIKADRNDNLWIATRGFGLIYWDREKQTFTQFKTLSKDKDIIDISYIKSLMIDKLDRIWIGTDGNGLVVFDKKKNEINHYSKNIEDRSMLSSNAVYSIFEDPKGIIWVGNYIMGLNKFVSDKLNFGTVYSSPYSETGLSHNLVTGFCEDKNNQIWVSTDGGGLNVFDRKTYQFKHYKHDPGNQSSISTNTTMALFCDHDNDIWIGTYNGGLNRFDQKTKNFYHYWHDPNDSTSLSSNHPWSFAQDKLNNIWVATVNAGLNLLKPGTTSFIRYSIQNENYFGPAQICSFALTQLFIDGNNFLWIGTEHGLDLVDLNQVDFSLPKPKLIFKHYIPSVNENSISYNRISCINEDSLGNLWIGTKGGGLNKLDIKTQTFTCYSVKDGLPHSIIDGILFDQDNGLWIGTNKGLSNFNVKTQKFKNYDSSDGLQSTAFLKTSCFKTSDGMFLFGGINGFNAFYPEKIISKISKYNTIITDLKLFNQSVAVGTKINDRILLPKPIFDLNEITLFYKENNIAFEFSALDYSNPEKIYYSYKLKGFDQEWQMTDAKMRLAKYTNLAPGEYTFKVKASNNDGVWNDVETSIKIIILPPWWMTLWFRVVFLFVLLFAIYIAYYLKVASYRKKQKELSELVIKRTAEITKANKELLERQTLIENQSEELRIRSENLTEANDLLVQNQTVIKSQSDEILEANTELVKLNKTKDRILSIIAHDLRNPFNVVSGFSEILLEEFRDLPLETIEMYLTLISNASKNGNILLGNLLQWSRTQTGSITFEPVALKLRLVAEETFNFLEGDALKKNITVFLKIDSALEIVADDNMVKTILRNLISNAIKFTCDKGIISVSAMLSPNQVEICVSDSGVGIPQEKIPLLFRIETNTSTKGTSQESGSGLGLILCKEFVERHHGKIWVESIVGVGTQFKFTLPVKLIEFVCQVQTQ
jgi:signal transduction histidine kinase/ligand-binding sensor domain-containing protein